MCPLQRSSCQKLICVSLIGSLMLQTWASLVSICCSVFVSISFPMASVVFRTGFSDFMLGHQREDCNSFWLSFFLDISSLPASGLLYFPTSVCAVLIIRLSVSGDVRAGINRWTHRALSPVRASARMQLWKQWAQYQPPSDWAVFSSHLTSENGHSRGKQALILPIPQWLHSCHSSLLPLWLRMPELPKWGIIANYQSSWGTKLLLL